jgi:hypothetical protein
MLIQSRSKGQLFENTRYFFGKNSECPSCSDGIQEVARSIRVSSTNKTRLFSVLRHRRMSGLSAFCPG